MIAVQKKMNLFSFGAVICKSVLVFSGDFRVFICVSSMTTAIIVKYNYGDSRDCDGF